MSQTTLATRPARAQTAASSTKAPALKTPTRKQLLLSVADAFAAKQKVQFGPLYEVEFKDTENEVRAMSIAGTPPEIADQVLSDAGIPTDGTVGGVMDGLPISRDNVHALVCNCLGEEITGEEAAERFTKLADAA